MDVLKVEVGVPAEGTQKASSNHHDHCMLTCGVIAQVARSHAGICAGQGRLGTGKAVPRTAVGKNGAGSRVQKRLGMWVGTSI